MKKLILGAVLMFASFAASAASFNINNPIVTGTGTVFSQTDNGVTALAPVGSIAGASFTGQLVGAASATANFAVFVNGLTNWSFSVIDNATNSVVDSIIGQTTTGTLVPVSVSVLGGAIYSLVFTGSVTDPLYVNATFVPVALSDVPLPAAVWLFGSVLLGGIAMRRRSQKMNAQAVAA